MVPTKRRSSASSASPKKPKLSTPSPTTPPDWLPDGWTVTVLSKPSGDKYKVYTQTATGKKFYSKPQVLNYLTAIPINADATNSISNNTKVQVAPPVSTLTTGESLDEIKRMLVNTLPSHYLRPSFQDAPPTKWSKPIKWVKFTKLPDFLEETSSSSSSEETSSSSTSEETSSSSSTSEEPVNKVAPPEKTQVSTLSTAPSEVPKQVNKVAPPEKTQVSTLSTAPSEVPKPLYDVIQNAARARKSLKLNSNNRFAKLKLEHYEPRIPYLAMRFIAEGELPSGWNYDPETSYVSKPPPSPLRPKTKKKKKIIEITWSSLNYHGRYLLNNDEQNVWNKFTINDRTEANEWEHYPMDKYLVTVEDAMVVDLLGKFAVDTFNKSCHMYLNRDEDNMVSGAEFIECKFYKLTKEYIFFFTIEAIERGIRGVYTTKVACETENGARTLLNFRLINRKPKGNMVKPQLESEGEYEAMQDGSSSDPQDFYKLTGMVHRNRAIRSGGFNYHNPKFSPHIILRSQYDKEARFFSPNVSGLSEFLAATKTS